MAEREPFSKVSDLYNWLGLSENGMRLYESEGIISPKRNSANGYRTLTISDGDRMFRSRILTGYGFTVKESADLLTACTFEQQDQAYLQKEREINDRIISLSFMLRQMQEMRSVMAEMKHDFSACTITGSVSYSFLPVHDQYQKKEAGSEECAAWLAEVPFVTSAVFFDLNDTGDVKYLYGPSLKYAEALRLQLPLSNAVIAGTESPHYVRGFCAYPLEDNIRPENFAHMKTYAENKGYEPFGHVLARHIVLEKVRNGGVTYDEVLIPVRKKL